LAAVNDKTYKIAVIGDRLLASGMGLSGVKHIYQADSQQQVEDAIREISAKSDIGIVIINENLMKIVKDRKLIRLIDSSLSPIFVGIPAYNQGEVYKDTLRRLIIRAIGIDISKSKQ
jgi:vacuolar-type H+-ATPase subunit F/Vma7